MAGPVDILCGHPMLHLLASDVVAQDSAASLTVDSSPIRHSTTRDCPRTEPMLPMQLATTNDDNSEYSFDSDDQTVEDMMQATRTEHYLFEISCKSSPKIE